MTARYEPSGAASGQGDIAAHLDRIRGLLQRRLAADEAAPTPPPAPGEGDVIGPDLATVIGAFGLTPFERDVLLLCAGVDLDAQIADLCAKAQADPRRRWPTFSLALAVLPEPHWSALLPSAPLRRWRLIEVGQGDSLTDAALRIDERVLHQLVGLPCLDERLVGLADAIEAPENLAVSHGRVAVRMAETWKGDGWPVLELVGPDPATRTAVAAVACATLGMPLLRIHAEDIPAPAVERIALVRLIERELALTGGALLVILDGETRPHAGRGAALFAGEMAGPLILAGSEPTAGDRRRRLRFDLPPPTQEERRQTWIEALGPWADKLDGQVAKLASHFNLSPDGVRTACATAITAADGKSEALAGALWRACREQARGRLDGLAQRIEATARWEDLVLPDAQLATLREAALHIRNSRTVYETWGFAAKSARSLGVSALFAGASGTGKTMAAEVLANDLDLDLYRVDLSQTVSKYIGETEKNLRQLFDAAEDSGAVLLFDEADALFGKRSDVKDSHDRYANIEVSYLLQRMETYRGLAVLTSNLKSALDTAFLRRIRFVVQFPFPDAAQRLEIWRRVFPAATPTRDVDYGRLAQLNLAGGHIRNVAMNAAFLAADESEPVGMDHLRRAARSEYLKLEKPLTSGELAGWS